MKAESNSADETKKVDPNLKKKQVLIVVLLVGLLVALLTQPEESVVEEGNTDHTEQVAQSVASKKTSDAQGADKKRLEWLMQSRQLSRIEIAKILDQSMFANEVIEPKHAQQIVSKTRRVQAIYGSADEHAALLGKTILRSGEPLPDGGRVLLVNDDGVHVSPKPRN